MVAHETFFIIIGCLFILFSLIIVLFSSMVLMIIRSHWRNQCRSVPNLLTCNSSIALLFYVLTISIQMPFYIQIVNFNRMDVNPIVCQLSACLATFSTIVLAYSYLIQAISRFFITILYKHRMLLTFRTNWMMIITSWIVSALIALGMFISPLAYQYELESHFCTLTTKNFHTSLTANIITGSLSINLMMIMYGIILYHTTRHTQINPHSASTFRARRNKVVFKKILISVNILMFGGLPYFVGIILNRIDRAPWPLYSIGFLTIAFASAINSVMLLITNDQVKGILRVKLTRRPINAVRPLPMIG